MFVSASDNLLIKEGTASGTSVQQSANHLEATIAIVQYLSNKGTLHQVLSTEQGNRKGVAIPLVQKAVPVC